MRLSRASLAFLVIGFIGQIIYYYPNLPEKMASHFNAVGEADNWTSKSNFIISEIVLLLIIIALFTLLPSLLEKMPVSFINLPHKEYWLADERRGQTFAIFRHYFEWLGIALLGLFIGINEFTFRANLNQQNLSNWFWLVLLFFLLFVGILTFRFMRLFKFPK